MRADGSPVQWSIPAQRGPLFGFYRDAEGRDFLREMMPLFFQQARFGVRKLSGLIADQIPGRQAAENENTRVALKRWLKGQDALWLRDPDKGKRCMRKLEGYMMDLASCKAVLADRAASVLNRRIGGGIADFLYSGEMNEEQKSNLIALAKDIEGLFCTLRYWRTSDSVESSSFPAFFHYFHYVPGKLFMIAHEVFMRRSSGNTEFEFSVKRSGFAYPLLNGSIYRLLSDKNDRSIRIIDMIRPNFDLTDHMEWIAPKVDFLIDRDYVDKNPGYYWDRRETVTDERLYLMRVQTDHAHHALAMIKNLLDDINLL